MFLYCTVYAQIQRVIELYNYIEKMVFYSIYSSISQSPIPISSLVFVIYPEWVMMLFLMCIYSSIQISVSHYVCCRAPAKPHQQILYIHSMIGRGATILILLCVYIYVIGCCLVIQKKLVFSGDCFWLKLVKQTQWRPRFTELP